MLNGHNELIISPFEDDAKQQIFSSNTQASCEFTFNMPFAQAQPGAAVPSATDSLFHYDRFGVIAQRPSNLALTMEAGDDQNDDSETDHTHSPPATAERVKRPMNAFMCWAKEERARLSAERAHKHNADLSRLLGQRWKAMSEEEKESYKQQAHILAQKHKREHPEYRYRPRRRQSGDRKVRGRRINSDDLSRVKAALSPEQLLAFMQRGGLRREQRSQSSASITSLSSTGDSASSNSIHNTSWDDLRLLADSVEAESLRMSSLAQASPLFHAHPAEAASSDIMKRSPETRLLPSCVNDRTEPLTLCPPPLLDRSNEKEMKEWYTVYNTVPLRPCPESLAISTHQSPPVTPLRATTPTEHSHYPPSLIDTSLSPTQRMPPPLQDITPLISPVEQPHQQQASPEGEQAYLQWLNHGW